MIKQLPVAEHICGIVGRLQEAGFEAYVVGGANRDLILGRIPKDYDISTSATPEEVRAVFGRRNARIIGKRFKLIHLFRGKEIIEISTFRRMPDDSHLPAHLKQKRARLPKNMILDDNEFGSSDEDAWRRDFSVNALFYDPNRKKLLDFTGMGLKDISDGVVRAIGDPQLRFEEDPVRMLRALKLVGQFGFLLEEKTAEALQQSLGLIQHAAQSRLSLELEKILRSTYADKILQTFYQYGFLKYFLPFFHENWNTPEMGYMRRLLTERNIRVERGCYRTSISIAVATMTVPFLERSYGQGRGTLWSPETLDVATCEKTIQKIFYPHTLVRRVTESASRVLLMQPLMRYSGKTPNITQSRSYLHARELLFIQNDVSWHQADLESCWSKNAASGGKKSGRRRSRYRRRPGNSPSGERQKSASGTEIAPQQAVAGGN